MNPIHHFFAVCAAAVGVIAAQPAIGAAEANPLDEYVAAPDPAFACHEVGVTSFDGGEIARYAVTSQVWRGGAWHHDLVIVTPRGVKPGGPVFLQVTGSGNGSRDVPFLQNLARIAGVGAAVVTHVPNQPLLDGLKEDDLISLTFQRYLETGDRSWPALFPMVKSVVRALDCLSAAEMARRGARPRGFIVSGSSKRGWTTWLTGAVDRRVEAIAPKVFDMLHMEAQTELAARSYGRQSDEISEYTDKGLVGALKHPRMQELLGWVDPFRFRNRLALPKLILIGTNDPYWVVDSLSQYWGELPEPKFVFQSPNTGHHLGDAANANLAAWVALIAAKRPVPRFSWELQGAPAALRFRTSEKPQALDLWKSCAASRDFRKAEWVRTSVAFDAGVGAVPLPRAPNDPRYCAYFAEAAFPVDAGQTLRLSTEAFVLPRE